MSVVLGRRPVARARAGVLATGEGRVGLILLALALAVLVLGPALAPYDPLETGVVIPTSGPQPGHPLGGDALGRDVLSRVLSGGRTIIVVPLVAITLSTTVGVVAGTGLGLLGGRGDAIVGRIVDFMLAFPPLLLALVLVASLGTQAVVIVVALVLVYTPRTARVIRAASRRYARADFVLAAYARGEPTRTVIVRELAPNLAAPALVEFALRLTYAIVFVAGLSFLGLGAQPPSPDWGLMVSEARTILTLNPWAAIAPAAMIGLLALSIGLIADAATRVVARDVER